MFRRHASNRPASEPLPDSWQLIAVMLLITLGSIPLLLELKPQIGLFIGAMLALRALSLRWPRLRPGLWLLGLLTLVGGLNVLDAYRGIAGQSPGTALLLSMMALKLLEVRCRRDLRVLLLLFGFVLVVQFLFDESPARTLLLSLLLVANFALLFDLTRSSHPIRLIERGRLAARVALTVMLQALPLALVLFIFFPRLDSPLWNLGLDKEQAVTGLRDWLEPGSIRDLVISGEEALRVTFDRAPEIPAERMYWRGPVLWHSDGRRWLPAGDAEFPDAQSRVEPLGDTLGYLVAMERTDQHWLIALDLPTEVPRDARMTSDFQVLASKPVDDYRFYRMSSAPSYRTHGLSLDEERAALALPENVTGRMRALVERWRNEVAGTEAGAEAIVQRALTHFNREPFRYTLLPPDLGDNPMDAFLFDERAGFCEHYAAAFTLLMRIADIPTRIVLGYLGGERNPISGHYLIRQSDAHAWTEVWLQGRGWVRVDPTAAVHPERVDQDGRLASLGAGAPVRFRLDDQGLVGRAVHAAHLLADAMGTGWRQWVVGFSRLKQQRLLDQLGLGQLRELGLALVMTIGGSLIMLVWSLLLSRPARERDPVLRAYQRFTDKLARVRLERRPNEGPLDHRDRIIAKRPDLAKPVVSIVGLYLRLRFAAGAGGADQALLEQRVRAFRPRKDKETIRRSRHFPR